MKKTGRNAPCPCGSGEKYKKCCLGTGVFTPGEKQKMVTIEQIQDRLKKFLPGEKRHFEKGFANAPVPLIPEEESTPEQNDLMELLMEWVIYDYRPPGGKTLFEKFLATEGKDLPEEVKGWGESYPTLFRVKEIDDKKVIKLEKLYSEQGAISPEIPDPEGRFNQGDVLVFRFLPLGENSGYFSALYSMTPEFFSCFENTMEGLRKELYPGVYEIENWEEFFREVPSFLLEVISHLIIGEGAGETMEEQYKEVIFEEKAFSLPPPELRFALDLPVWKEKSLREASFEQEEKDRLKGFLQSFIREAGMEKEGPEWRSIRELLGLDIKRENPLSSLLEWPQPDQQREAELMEEGFRESLFPLDLEIGLTFWKNFCDIENPRINKAGTWAASMEYLVSMIAQMEISQKEMAEKYGVSVSSISRNIKRCADLFSKIDHDPFREIPE